MSAGNILWNKHANWLVILVAHILTFASPKNVKTEKTNVSTLSGPLQANDHNLSCRMNKMYEDCDT